MISINLRFRVKEIPHVSTFIGTQHTEDTQPISRKRDVAAALVIALTLGSQLIAPQKAIAQVNKSGNGHTSAGAHSASKPSIPVFSPRPISLPSPMRFASSGLQTHGFGYINIDSGWQGSFDANGRPIPNSTTFPNITALVDHIHQNGQKAGIYWIPGVEYPAVVANSPILGTPYHIQDILVVPYTAGNAFGAPGTSPYHYKIDFTKPGAQEYMNSVVALFASMGHRFHQT